MPKVDEESARLALMELAEAFGSDDISSLLPIAMAGRLYLEDGKAVYILRSPIDKANGEKIAAFRLREPSAADFLAYSKGMTVIVSREGATEIDMVMMGKRTIRAVAKLADQVESIVERMSRRDLDDLTNIGDALGFFD
jgi:hypothetical protein